jgi:hypothetical protein
MSSSAARASNEYGLEKNPPVAAKLHINAFLASVCGCPFKGGGKHNLVDFAPGRFFLQGRQLQGTSHGALLCCLVEKRSPVKTTASAFY